MVSGGVLLLLVAILPRLAAQCPQEIFTASTATVMSSNYPMDYDNELNCLYHISVPTGFDVQLTFYEFHTESCCDIVYVYSGNDTTNLIARLSGTAGIGKVLRSNNSNSMLLQFVTDATTVFHGFYGLVIPIKVGDDPLPNDICPPGLYKSAFGVVTSPNWPFDYPNLANCDYLISSVTGKIQLQFVAFETEKCCDIVEIFDGGDHSAPLIARLSGSDWVGASYTSASSQLFIHFESDHSTVFSGFSAIYEIKSN